MELVAELCERVLVLVVAWVGGRGLMVVVVVVGRAGGRELGTKGFVEWACRLGDPDRAIFDTDPEGGEADVFQRGYVLRKRYLVAGLWMGDQYMAAGG